VAGVVPIPARRPKIRAIAGYPQDGIGLLLEGRALNLTDTFRRLIVLSMLTGLLAACATSPEQQALSDNERCTARGHQPNS
jgi:hypothetical protein